MLNDAGATVTDDEHHHRGNDPDGDARQEASGDDGHQDAQDDRVIDERQALPRQDNPLPQER